MLKMTMTPPSPSGVTDGACTPEGVDAPKSNLPGLLVFVTFGPISTQSRSCRRCRDRSPRSPWCWRWCARTARRRSSPELPRRDALEGWRGKADIRASRRGPVAGVGEHQVEPAIAVDVHSVDRTTAVDIPRAAGRAIRPRLPEPRGTWPHPSATENPPLTSGEESCNLSNS